MIHVITSPKGGVGVTTVASALAAHLSKAVANRPTTLVEISETPQVHACLGLPFADEPVSAHDNLHIHRTNLAEATAYFEQAEYGPVVMDWSHTHNPLVVWPDHVSVTMVVENGYLALQPGMRESFDRVLVRTFPGRALNIDDVRSVYDLEHDDCFDLPEDPAIARTIDAGLLLSRCPARLGSVLRWLTKEQVDELA